MTNKYTDVSTTKQHEFPVFIVSHGGGNKPELKGEVMSVHAYQGMERVRAFPHQSLEQPACSE